MPSVVSTSDMPAVNKIGNTSTDQNERPCDAWAADMPNNATSVAVSNPSPKRNPTG